MKRRVLSTMIVMFFYSVTQAAKTTIDINQSFHKDTILSVFNTVEPICSASINLSANALSSRAFFRVVLVDDSGRKYLLAESYKEIADNDNSAKKYADETDVLDNVIPAGLEIYIRDVALNVHSVEVVPESRTHSNTRNSQIPTRLRTSKVQEKVDKINAYNNSHNKLWRAGVTELSLLPFDDRMRILGVGPSDDTGGFEYYVGGIFEVGEREDYQQPLHRSNTLVDEFDWTNRHGKNWITSIKGQGYSCYCSAFTGAACVEALTNLYYNQKIDLDLSELEIANCCGSYNNPYTHGLTDTRVCRYLRDTGVCDENSYPFLDDPNDSLCRSDQITPQYRVKINGFYEIPYAQYQYEDSLKKFLINYGPLFSGFFVSNDPASGNGRRSHAMALVGYGTIHAGDSIRIITSGPTYWDPSTISAYYVVPDDSPLIGRSYFKFKNSNNIRVNDDVDGYMHIMFHNFFQLGEPIRLLYPFDITSCQTSQPLYTDADVVCEDADGDGYYFWGLGPKPTSCPATVPDAPDGDDSDPTVGPIDEYGNMTVLTNEFIISSFVEHNKVYTFSHDIRIVTGGHLCVKDTTTLTKGAQIIVENGGTLTIDGGLLNKARITLCTGSTLVVMSNGTINMAAGQSFLAPVGAIVNMLNGKII